MSIALFEEVPADSFYVGRRFPTAASSGSRSTRWRGTLPGPVIREMVGSGNLDQVIAPWVKDRGYDWEFTIHRARRSTCGRCRVRIPPPFESMAEKRWIKENKATPYDHAGRSSRSTLGPGPRHDRRSDSHSNRPEYL